MKRYFSLSLFFLPFLAVRCLAAETPTLPEILRAWGLAWPGAAGYKVEKSYRRGDWEGNERPGYWTVVASSGGCRLRLEATRNIGAAAAQKNAYDCFASLDGIFNGYAFYPGMLTQRFEVPAELQPEALAAGPGGYKTYILYSTNNFTYGVGDPGLAVYRGALTHRYSAGAKTLAKVEIFVPKERFNQEALLEELQALTPQ